MAPSASPRLRTPALALAVVVLSLVLTGVACGGGDDGGGGGSTSATELSAAGRRGKQVARDNGCTACHTTDGSDATGPTWKDLAGSEVQLDDGSTVTADDAYLARAITDPKSQVVKGFGNLMPEAYGGLSDDEVADLVAYLRDLSSSDR